MSEAMQGGDAQLALAAAGSNPMSGKLEEPDHSSSNWYFSREEIEKNSPSRKDGIDLKKETYFRKSYCTFLQELGIRLKVPQVTIATAIVFSHRFFLRQSHAKNDRHMIATICMFIAGKVEETPRPLRDVIWLSYENRFKKDASAVRRIKQKEVYETEKERMLLGEQLVLTTLGFDLNIHHPYKPLVAAIKKFQVAANTLAQVAWNFVNDGLRTSLCLQFKPHHIAAGAIFLAAKFLKVKLPSEGDKAWWQEFEVNPRQLEEVSNQMLELYEQNKSATGSRMSDPSSSAGPYNRLKAMAISQAAAERAPGTSDHPSAPARLPAIVKTEDEEVEKSSRLVETPVGTGEVTDARSSLEDGEDMAESKLTSVAPKMNTTTTITTTTEVTVKTVVSMIEVESSGMKAIESKLENKKETKSAFLSLDEVDTDKVKAAMEKRRRSSVEGIPDAPSSLVKELTDEEELLERELESGVEAASEAKKVTKHSRHETKGKPLCKVERDSGAAEDIIQEVEVSVASTMRENANRGDGKVIPIHKIEHKLQDFEKEESQSGQVVVEVERVEKKSKIAHSDEHERTGVKSERLHKESAIEFDKVKLEKQDLSEHSIENRDMEFKMKKVEDGCPIEAENAEGERCESSSTVRHRGMEHEAAAIGEIIHNGHTIGLEVEHKRLHGAEKGEIKPDGPHEAEHEPGFAKRDGTNNGEVVAAAKRKRGSSGVDGSGIDRKKTKEQEEWADTSSFGRSAGPVELPPCNQELAPRQGDKKPHASTVGPDRGVISPESQRLHNQSRWELNGSVSRQNGLRDGRHGGHGRDHPHNHQSSFHFSHPSYRRTTHQQRPEGDCEWRYYEDRDYVDPDHKKMRHEHVH